jgi:hypothetical protein
MVPAGTTNLLVSGRCVSADENAFSAVRVMGTTMALGEAAGIAAAIMAVRTLPAAAVPIAEVRETLRARGAFLPPMR